MAKTLLNAVNETFKRVNVTAGDAGALTTLIDSARQHPIDVAVQVINEGIDELYSASDFPIPKEQKESSISLVAGTRAYDLATDLIQLRWPLIDKTNSQFIVQYPGNYNDMLLIDPEQDDAGLPHWGVISPVNGQIFLDRAPSAADAGRVYTYQYDKNLALSAADDAVPFNDAAFRAMVPVWVQLYKREMRNEFDSELYRQGIGRAARFVIEVQPRQSYSPR